MYPVTLLVRLTQSNSSNYNQLSCYLHPALLIPIINLYLGTIMMYPFTLVSLHHVKSCDSLEFLLVQLDCNGAVEKLHWLQ